MTGCSALSPQEYRETFLQESCHSLPGIIGGYDACKSSLFDRQAILDRCIHAAMNRRQRCGQCKRRFRGNLLCQRNRFSQQLGARHRAVDQTKAQRLVSVECPSGQDQFDGGFTTNVPRQSLGAAERRNDPDVYLCLGEGSVLRRKGDVDGLD